MAEDPAYLDSFEEPEPTPIGADEYREATGESLERTLDLGTWQDTPDFQQIYDRLSAEVAEAVAQERRTQNVVREIIFPKLASQPGAPEAAGVYQATAAQIEQKHRGILLNGK